MEIQPGIDIYLGDCLQGLRGGLSESVDYTFTDPPYNVNLVPQRGTHKAIANDNLSPEEFEAWMGLIAAELWRVHKPDTVAHVCCNWRSLSIFERAFGEHFTVKGCAVWVKNNFGIGYHMRPQHEFVLLCFKGEPKPPAKAPSDVWEFAKVHNTVHSCEKPVPLVEFAMGLYTKIGDLTCDPFMGSGTTADAAYRCGRRFIGWELMPEHFEITKSRFRQVRFAFG